MRILITGGTGLIGTPLSQQLAASGHEVIVLSRNPGKYTLPAGVTAVAWDGRTSSGWAHLADGAGAIINLAGESIGGSGFPPPRWTTARKQRILQSRLDAGQAVTAAVQAAAVKPGVVVQMSGIDYYGNVPGNTAVTETSSKGNGFLSDVTEQWEASTAVVETLGVRRVVLRTGIVLSLDGGALPQTMLPFKFFAGGPLGNGRQWWPWIHLADVIRAMQFLVEHENASGVFNVCAPNPLPEKEFGRVLGQVMARPSLIPAPAFALKLMLGEMAAMVLDGRRAVPTRLQELGFTFQYPEAREALLDLLNH
ncbi:MAG: TIGR01777 family protein [Chloroflexi bacterium]|nr:TIGR01777 family protein [Ardenticatenaceae bacterium]MBL1128536.1 TIGR01777 family protein [Chloroflexota bacterium]NOG34615.1 TIGR01777 family protein [Chloroflexota bacterium]GIK56695.1 MAG: epimerase [Chloroflexota bacterium]